MRLVTIRASITIVLALVVLAPASRAEFHLELSGVLFRLDGPRPVQIEPPFVTGVPTSSQLFGFGPGFSVGASLDWGTRFTVGARSGLLRVRDAREVVLVVDPPGNPGPFQFPGTFRHRLTMVPTHGLLRYRAANTSRTALYAQVGVGVISFTEKFAFDEPGEPPEPLGAYQTSFSYLAGGGITRAVYRRIAIAAGADFVQALTQAGEIWRSGDNPWLVVGTAGIRYPF